MDQRTSRNNIVVILCVLLFVFFFWKCPIQELFGIPCPGCNMTTSLYYLCLGNIKSSLFYHPLGIVLIVCILMEGIFYLKYKKLNMWILYGFIILMVLVYIYRMVTIFPQIPMVYVEENFLSKLKTLFF